jgi:antitoxin component YwqK of YwqJK toxin-antitoxin module
MKQVLSLLFLLGLVESAYSQTEPLNQLDSVGKKHGYWVEYLDYYWNLAKDSNQAVYYWYLYFDHGQNTATFGKRGKQGWRFEPASDTVGQKEKPILLDGKYTSWDDKGKLRIEQEWNKGEPVYYKSYSKTGELWMHMNYKEKWNNTPHTYAIYHYKKNGDVKLYYVSESNGKWASYYSDWDSITTDTTRINGDSAFVTTNVYSKGQHILKADKILFSNNRGETKPYFMFHGNYVAWYPNGQKRDEGEFYFNRNVGEWKHWDKKGNLVSK